MTRDEIIKAMHSVCDKDKVDAWQNGFWTITQEELGRFAAIVAAAEREECAKFLESGVDLKGLAGDPQMQAFCGALLMGCAKAIRSRENA